MIDVSRLEEHLEVVGSDGGHVGPVDHVLGDRVSLTLGEDQARDQWTQKHQTGRPTACGERPGLTANSWWPR